MIWFRKKGLEPAAQAYYDQTRFRNFKPKQELSKLRIVVLDAETTGFDYERDRMISLAALESSERRFSISTLRAWTIKQDRNLLTEAVKVHGLLPPEIENGSEEKQVLEEFLPLLANSLVVGHHIQFDANMLDRALRRHYGIGLRNPILDTAYLARHALDAFAKVGYANQGPPTLEEACAQCNIDPFLRHTAAGDTYTTAELFLHLCARMRSHLKRPLKLGDLPYSRFRA